MKALLAVALVLLAIGCVHVSQGKPAACAGQIYSCFVSPCMTAKCAVSGAKCVADYCGGCNARWYDAAGAEVTSQCAPKA